MQKILVIDDDRDMCLLLKRFLSKHGYEVDEANTSKRAIELMDTTEYHLVLCDFRLDNIDGKAMLVKIKEKFPHLKLNSGDNFKSVAKGLAYSGYLFE